MCVLQVLQVPYVKRLNPAEYKNPLPPLLHTQGSAGMTMMSTFVEHIAIGIYCHYIVSAELDNHITHLPTIPARTPDL